VPATAEVSAQPSLIYRGVAPVPAAIDAPISIWNARGADVAAHFAIRHHVFVIEQGVLVMTDIDRWDDCAEVVHVLAARARTCAGAVRLYPLDDNGRWRGDRLAVLKAHRSTQVGAQLVQYATSTAAARDGRVMEARIQLANVAFFERLGWTKDGDAYPYLGLPHQPMMFDLSTATPLNWRGRPDLVAIEGQIDVGSEHLCPV
jgi:putative N-acetyltransferase (TIGR04045 family)